MNKLCLGHQCKSLMSQWNCFFNQSPQRFKKAENPALVSAKLNYNILWTILLLYSIPDRKSNHFDFSKNTTQISAGLNSNGCGQNPQRRDKEVTYGNLLSLLSFCLRGGILSHFERFWVCCLLFLLTEEHGWNQFFDWLQRWSDFPPENCIALLSNLAAERLKASRFFSYLLIKNPFNRPREIKISQFLNSQNASQDVHVLARNCPADRLFLIGCR